MMNEFLNILFAKGTISAEERMALTLTCQDLCENPVRIIRSLNIMSSREIPYIFHTHFGYPTLSESDLFFLAPDKNSQIPIDLAIYYSCFALKEGENNLDVVFEDPTDLITIRQLEFFMNKKIKPVVADVFQICEALQKIYSVSSSDLRLTTLIEKSRGVVGGEPYYETIDPPQPVSYEDIQAFEEKAPLPTPLISQSTPLPTTDSSHSIDFPHLDSSQFMHLCNIIKQLLIMSYRYNFRKELLEAANDKLLTFELSLDFKENGELEMIGPDSLIVTIHEKNMTSFQGQILSLMPLFKKILTSQNDPEEQSEGVS